MLTTKITLQKNILLLQGPIGPFFKNFAKFAKRNGTNNVYKINFTLGDAYFFYGENTTLYTKGINEWESFLVDCIKKHDIKQIFLLSDSRPLHKLTVNIVQDTEIEIYVFEQGYKRPNRITLERNGVNGASNLSKCPNFYLKQNNLKEKPGLQRVNLHNFRYAIYVLRFYTYYLPIYSALLVLTKYINNKYHQIVHYSTTSKIDTSRQIIIWHLLGIKKLISPILKLVCNSNNRRNIEWLNNKFYTLLLQVPTDFQVKQYSKFKDMYHLINFTMRSFSKYASNDSRLLIKQHPLDEIHNNYHSFIKRCCLKYKISKERVLYVTDIHLPSVFQKSIGTITINSTAGMSSLHHNTPTICLTDKCIYNIESITYQGKLNNFWSEAGTFKIDRKVFSNFNKYIDQHTQIVGSGFWGKFELNRMEELIEVKDG